MGDGVNEDLFQYLDNHLGTFFVHDDGEQFSIVMENRPVARVLVFDDVVHGSGIWMDVSSTKAEPQKQSCRHQAESQHDSPFEESEQPRKQKPVDDDLPVWSQPGCWLMPEYSCRPTGCCPDRWTTPTGLSACPRRDTRCEGRRRDRLPPFGR